MDAKEFKTAAGSCIISEDVVASIVATAALETEGIAALANHTADIRGIISRNDAARSLVDYLIEYAQQYYSDTEFETRCRKYDYAKPFTKESLLYREVFEKYYPGQAEMIAGFWMPNKDWKGCNVNDPSARVLSNYGSSGI